jgi:hypothetical protein
MANHQTVTQMIQEIQETAKTLTTVKSDPIRPADFDVAILAWDKFRAAVSRLNSHNNKVLGALTTNRQFLTALEEANKTTAATAATAGQK